MEGVNLSANLKNTAETAEAFDREENIENAQRSWIEMYSRKGSAVERVVGKLSFENASGRF